MWVKARPFGRAVWTLAIAVMLRCLTFELSGRRRQDAKPGLAKMDRVPPDRAWWPAVGAPLERGVRRRSQRNAAGSYFRRHDRFASNSNANGSGWVPASELNTCTLHLPCSIEKRMM